MTTRSALRLRTGALTVLLGAPADRERLLADVDEDTASCREGHAVAAVARLSLHPSLPAPERVRRLSAAHGLAVLLLDRPTAGLDGTERRAVLGAVRNVAAHGTAVLLHDVDPVAALSVADAALRVAPDGSIREDDLQP